jgi:hypothetical protein
MYRYILSVLIAEGSCNNCSDDHRWYFHMLEDGSIKLWYEGCGGMMGRAFARRGEDVDRDKAVSDLERCINLLHEERRELFANLHAAEKMLKRLKRTKTVR